MSARISGGEIYWRRIVGSKGACSFNFGELCQIALQFGIGAALHSCWHCLSVPLSTDDIIKLHDLCQSARWKLLSCSSFNMRVFFYYSDSWIYCDMFMCCCSFSQKCIFIFIAHFSTGFWYSSLTDFYERSIALNRKIVLLSYDIKKNFSLTFYVSHGI